jgi:hypothetical protein
LSSCPAEDDSSATFGHLGRGYRPWVRWLRIVAVAAVVAGCGGDDDEGAAAPVDPVADQAGVDARIADLEARLEADGYVAQEAHEAEPADELSMDVPECGPLGGIAEDLRLPGQTATAETGSFQLGDLMTSDRIESIGAELIALDTAHDEELAELFDFIEGGEVARCFEAAFEAQRAPTSQGEIVVEALDPPAVADAGAGIRMALRAPDVDPSFDIGGDLYFLRVGQRAVVMSVSGLGPGDSEAPVEEYLEILVGPEQDS